MITNQVFLYKKFVVPPLGGAVKLKIYNMEQFRNIIEQEEKRFNNIITEMYATLAEEQADRHRLTQEISELKEQRLDAIDWKEKQEINDRIAVCRDRHEMRLYQDFQITHRPYFGILEIDDNDLGSLSYCLGPRSFFAGDSRILVIDWREAPISRLYYEYDIGDDYDETIQNRDRTGIIKRKRQVDTTGGKLHKISDNGSLLVCDENGIWKEAINSAKTISQKESKGDHRLPEITSLISAAQFQTITHPESATILLQGGAGSGKTTVGLHRIAYLVYQNPERFRKERILVVMFNRSLQKYISGVLPDLGIGEGVIVETYHGWASRLFHAANIQVSYNSETPPTPVIRFKKDAAVLSLVEYYLKNLLQKSRIWFLEQLEKNNDPDIGKIRNILIKVTQFDLFFQTLNTHPLFLEEPQPDYRNKSRLKLLSRLCEHETDLYAALSDQELLDNLLKKPKFQDAFKNPAVLIRQIAEWQTRLYNRKQIDFADTGILLWLMQQKGIRAASPEYAHIMVDEAQDLSEVELATLLYAADKEQSVTICGDMAQKIKNDVSFKSSEGFAGFIREIQENMGVKDVSANTLTVGYRATRPIMELAWHVLGDKPPMTVPRDGKPVKIIRTKTWEETAVQTGNILNTYLEERPNALVGVICRYKADADQIFEKLKRIGVINLRRCQRDDFSFQPGVIVTNAHQVKGLEFSAIIIINPNFDQYRDNRENRMLLHMVMTRASDQLWIIGHQQMAYGIEDILNPKGF